LNNQGNLYDVLTKSTEEDIHMLTVRSIGFLLFLFCEQGIVELSALFEEGLLPIELVLNQIFPFQLIKENYPFQHQITFFGLPCE